MKIGAKLACHMVMNCGDLILWSGLGPAIYKVQSDRCQSRARHHHQHGHVNKSVGLMEYHDDCSLVYLIEKTGTLCKYKLD
ncbi:unnamed protein product [Callosobruchus maculatus]|uniref:Uncharacterized protein n=1 Tax=Callosobruchus maculatus TaxID=64391 RepID=A0A653CSN2_CALMS|nr:unnamed protein product [Callosobruchus maculatus]